MEYPANYQFTKEHEWALVENGTARIGITDHAQHALGDIVFVELPAPGTELTAGQVLGTVESVKAVSDIFSPLPGKVTAVNSQLAQSPELVNQDPHGRGWLVQLELTPGASLPRLLHAAEYAAYVAEEN